MIMSAALSMFIDSITVILFLAAVTVELSQLLKFNPVPMIISEIFCANLGGSATMCGDPPNIIIGTSFNYSFSDFIQNTGVMAGICMVFILIFFFFAYRKELSTTESVDTSNFPQPKSVITDKKGFIVSSIIFLAAVILLITHSMTGFTVPAIGVFIAIATLITSIKHIPEIISKVDHKTLLFFVGLFVVIGGLEQTGVLEIIASFIGKISGGNVYLLIAIIIWVSAMAETTGASLPTMTWALAMGTDVGGNATPIGASANVVGTSVAAKAGYPISWGVYCKKAVPATILALAICTVIIFIRYL
jgi:Na+/H+ antiporter NhaD/arsenite permease-like protein